MRKTLTTVHPRASKWSTSRRGVGIRSLLAGSVVAGVLFGGLLMAAPAASAAVSPQRGVAATQVGNVGAPQLTMTTNKQSNQWAGYWQTASNNGKYYAIFATLVVPTATDVDGPFSIATDEVFLGGTGSGPAAGLEITVNGDDEVFYSIFSEWDGEYTTFAQVSAGDQLQLTVETDGLVEILDTTTGQEYGSSNPGIDPVTTVGAIEERYLAQDGDYVPLAKTTPVEFKFDDVTYSTPSDPDGRSAPLLAPPTGFGLLKYKMVTERGHLIAASSKPTDNGHEFTITDK